MKRQHNHAFSLVELSIVLVILGLLVGGILAGQSLIRASEIRSIGADYQRHTTSIAAFRDKYFGYPGDIANATSIWGDQATGTGSCADAAIANGTPGTCNGDADGSVGNITMAERFRAWQQLSLAGLVEGTYSGVTGPGSTYHAVIGTNVPAGKISGTGFTLWSINSRTSNTNFYDGYYGLAFSFGAAATNDITLAPAIRPEEAWNLDTKLDDGRPAYGTITAYKSTSIQMPNCTTADTSAIAQYNLTNSALLCGLVLRTGL